MIIRDTNRTIDLEPIRASLPSLATPVAPPVPQAACNVIDGPRSVVECRLPGLKRAEHVNQHDLTVK